MSSTQEDTEPPLSVRSGFENLPLYQPPPPLVPKTQQQVEEDRYRKMTTRGRPRMPNDEDFAKALLKLPERDDDFINMLKPTKPRKGSVIADEQDNQGSTTAKGKRSVKKQRRSVTLSDKNMPVTRKRPVRRPSPMDEQMSVGQSSDGPPVSSEEEMPIKRKRPSRFIASADEDIPIGQDSDAAAVSTEEEMPIKRKRRSRYPGSTDEEVPVKQLSPETTASTDEDLPIKRKGPTRYKASTDEGNEPAVSTEEDMPIKRKAARPRKSSKPPVRTKERTSDSSSPGSPLAATHQQRMSAARQEHLVKPSSYKANSPGSLLTAPMRPSQASIPVTPHLSVDAASKGSKRDSLADASTYPAVDDDNSHSGSRKNTPKNSQQVFIDLTKDE